MLLAMSRTSSDYYHIPLRSLGRGRRKAVRQPSTSEFRDERGNGYAVGEGIIGEDDDERASSDELPLITKYQVCAYVVFKLGKWVNVDRGSMGVWILRLSAFMGFLGFGIAREDRRHVRLYWENVGFMRIVCVNL